MSVDLQRPLRVMTYNIRNGRGMDWHVDLPRIARVIRDAGVDVVGLQEVDRHFDPRSDFVDQATRLGGMLGMHVVFAANIDLDPPAPDRPRRQFGSATLSVHPVLDWDNTHLPRFGDHEQRGLLRARIDVGGEPWLVYTTHLQHNDGAERFAQARAVAALIGAPEHPVVLLGDLNATPGRPETRTLTELLRDAWTQAGGWCGGTFASLLPLIRLDYVLHSPDVRARAARVVGTSQARLASDHLPVVADLVRRSAGQ